MADDRLVSRAIEILEKYGPRGRMSLDEAIETLASFPPFDRMGDEDLAPIAATALARRGPAAAPRAGGDERKALPARTRAAPDAAMLTAPYRFVVIDDRVVLAQPETKAANWGFPIKGGFSGDIEVEWAFETPMLIGVEDGKGVCGPMKLGDEYVIPGASLRGTMRAAMGIVCRARLTQINAHHRYGVRDFTHPLFKEGQGAGAQRLAWGNLKAGWLRTARPGDPEKKDSDSDYVLTPCDKKIVRIRALPAEFNGGKPTANGQWHRDWLGTKLAERYTKAGYVKEKIGAKKFIFDFESSPPTAFSSDPLAKTSDPTAKDHVIPGGGGVGSGWFVFSNNSPSLRDVEPGTLDQQDASPSPGNQKKREYVFIDDISAKPVRLRQEAFDRFVLINSKPGKTKPKPDGSYAVMEPTLKVERRIPVFYAGDLADQELDFDIGLTRLFKLSHENSVGAVLERQKAHKLILRGTPDERRVFEDPDMVESLFGHVYDHVDFEISTKEDLPDGAARKGRIAFGFARLSHETPAAVEALTAALAHDVDWRGQTGLFVPRIDNADRRVVETEGISPPPARGFVLRFVSPLALSGADPRERPASLFTGLGQRLESLARWHDATLGALAERPHLAERARTLTFDFGECDSVSWTRGSRRQDRAIPMRGLVGGLEIGGPGAADPAVGAKLALGATCHIGADAAFGCGRYELGVIPLSNAEL